MLNRDCRKDKGEKSTHRCNCLHCARTGVRSGVVMKQEELIHRPVFGRNLRIHCFNFLNVCTHRSDCAPSPPPRIPADNKIPSLSQKSLAITLTAEVCTLNFFLSGDNCPLTVSSSVIILHRKAVPSSSLGWKSSPKIFFELVSFRR